MKCVECGKPCKELKNEPQPIYCSKECFEAGMKKVEK